MKRYLLIFCTLIMPIFSSAVTKTNFDTHQWELKKQANGIQIFIANVPGSDFKSVRGKMLINASLNSLVGLILDTDVCSEWAYLCKQSHIHKRISDTEFYLYTATNPPWPVKNRDVLVHVNIKQQREDFSVVIESVAKKGIYPEQEHNLRVTEATSIWKFIPLDNGQVQVESYSHVNPAGAIPVWFNNMLLTKTPYISLKNMREIVKSGKYNQHRQPYIKELIN